MMRGSLEHRLRRIDLQNDAPEGGMLGSRELRICIERALGELASESDEPGVGEQLCKAKRCLTTLRTP